MFRFRFLVSILVVCLLAGTGLMLTQNLSANASEHAITLRLGHSHPVASQLHLGALRFAQLVRAKTDGHVKIDVYANSSIADEPGLAENIRGGRLDIALLASGNVAAYNPDFHLFDIPYLFSSYAQVDSFLHGSAGQAMAEVLEDSGIRVLSYWEAGFRNLTNSVRPIAVPADLKGLSINTHGWPGLSKLMSTLGATPKAFKFSDEYKACADGQIDAQEGPIFAIRATRLYQVQKYLTLTEHAYTPMILGIHSRKFRNLPADYQKAILEAAAEAAIYEHRIIRDQQQSDLKFLQSKGMEVTTLTDKQAWIDAVKPLQQELLAQINPEIVKAVSDK